MRYSKGRPEMAEARRVSQLRAIAPVESLPWTLARVLSARRVRLQRTVTVAITLAVAFTVASSFALTALIGSMVRGFTQRVEPVDLPFDAAVLFDRQADVAAFMQAKGWAGLATVRIVPWAPADSPQVGLTLIGMDGVPQGELRPVTASLPGWRYADPVVVRGLPGVGEAAVFTLFAKADKSRLLVEVSKLQVLYPSSAVTERSGLSLADAASRRAFLPWQAISLGVLSMSAAAISCVLAVTFLGRKRSLGILKALGSTTGGLMRLFLLETGLMGGMGIPLGLLLGSGVAVWALGQGAVTVWCFAVSAAFGMAALALGVLLPVRLVRNGSCEQLLNNRPVYAISNPSCAKCGLCGGF